MLSRTPDPLELSRIYARRFEGAESYRRQVWKVLVDSHIKFTGEKYRTFLDHHIPLTELSLKEALEITGFQTETLIDRFPPYTMPNAPRYLISFLGLYLKLPAAWRFFGQRFLIIASKSS
jgi:hypothetical protein